MYLYYFLQIMNVALGSFQDLHLVYIFSSYNQNDQISPQGLFIIEWWWWWMGGLFET